MRTSLSSSHAKWHAATCVATRWSQLVGMTLEEHKSGAVADARSLPINATCRSIASNRASATFAREQIRLPARASWQQRSRCAKHIDYLSYIHTQRSPKESFALPSSLDRRERLHQATMHPATTHHAPNQRSARRAALHMYISEAPFCPEGSLSHSRFIYARPATQIPFPTRLCLSFSHHAAVAVGYLLNTHLPKGNRAVRSNSHARPFPLNALATGVPSPYAQIGNRIR
jgi:hypothetical protein